MKINNTSFWVLPILACLVAIGPLSTDMYLPAQPAIKEELSATLEQIQLTLSIFLIGTSVALPFWGPLADRFGRRPILIAGFTLFIASSFGCAFAKDIESLILFRFLQSVGACVGPTIGRTMVRDIYGVEGAAKAFGYLASIMALAPAVAPIIGGFLVERLDWQSIFYALAVAAVISCGIYLYFIGETLTKNMRQSIHPQNIWNNYKVLAVDRIFLAYVLMMSFVFSGLFAFISAASFIFIEFLGLSPQQFGYCFLGMVIGFVIGSSLGGKLTGRVKASKLICSGILISLSAGLIGSALSLMEIYHALTVVIPVGLYAMGAGLVLPQCNAASLKNYPHIAGTASSLSGIVQNTLAAFIGVSVASLHSETPTVMMAFLCLGGFVALLFFFTVLPKTERTA
jgi:DHA1 family bicyclomycin/chloramphenicol resistance-like MFS transporter